MESFKLSSRLFSEIFWFSILNDTDTLANYKDQLTNEFELLDKLRIKAEYSTGSISLSDAWCLFCLTNYFKPLKVIEIGTFIGKSTWSIAKSLEIQQNDNCEIFTCDFSNDIKIPWTGKTKINQFPKTSSTDMLKQIKYKIDFLFVDGRLNKEDIVQIEGLMHDDAIIVLDDFEGSEKGVANLFNLKTSSKLKNHYLIYPCQYNTLKNFGFTSHSLTAILIPASSIKLTSQG